MSAAFIAALPLLTGGITSTPAQAAPVVAAAPVALLPADQSNGNGTGGWTDSGTVVSSGFHWRVASANGDTNAFTTFVANSGSSPAIIRNRLSTMSGGTSTGKSLLSVCEESDYIWWVHSGNIWVYNFTGKSYPSLGSSSFDTANNYGGYAPTPEALTQARNYLANVNTQNLSIVCSSAWEGEPKPPPPLEWDNENSWETSEQNDYTVTRPYSFVTDVYPQTGIDPGKPNLHAQAGAAQKTNYGKLADDIAAGRYKDTPVATIKAAVAAALAADKTLNHSRVDLDAANTEGMAEGGILHVNERTRYWTISASQKKIAHHTQTCNSSQSPVWDAGAKKWGYGPVVTTCSTTVTYSWEYSANTTQATLRQTGFWSMLSVKCNPQGFNALVAATGATVENTGDPTRNLAAVAYSKKYAQQPAVLDFGQPGTPSGSIGFYDKECPYDCVSKGPGATNANGGTSNVNGGAPAGGNTPTPSERYGVIGDRTNNTGNLVFFRDNEPHLLNVDTWWPRSGGNVSYDGHAPLSTTITRWGGSTPGLTAGDNGNGGQFSMNLSNASREVKESVFDPRGQDPLNQRNWDPMGSTPATSYRSKTAALFPGLQRYFTVQGTFASDKDKPVVLNVKYEYAPNVSTVFADKGVGFGPGGVRAWNAVGTHAAPTQGKCYANFGTTNSASNYAALVQQNTGTGTTNGLDGRLVQGEATPPASNPTNLFITFVRSTSE